jgi:hypothetical protein
MAQGVELLPSSREALSLNPNTSLTPQKNKGEELTNATTCMSHEDILLGELSQ